MIHIFDQLNPFKFSINAVHHPAIFVEHRIEMIEPGKFSDDGFVNLVYHAIHFQEITQEELYLRFNPHAVYYARPGITDKMAISESLKGFKCTGMWEIVFETESDLIAFKLKYNNEHLIE